MDPPKWGLFLPYLDCNRYFPFLGCFDCKQLKPTKFEQKEGNYYKTQGCLTEPKDHGPQALGTAEPSGLILWSRLSHSASICLSFLCVFLLPLLPPASKSACLSPLGLSGTNTLLISVTNTKRQRIRLPLFESGVWPWTRGAGWQSTDMELTPADSFW